MPRLPLALLSLGLALSMPASAAMASTLGVYQTTDRKMDYELALCGSDGRALCVTLLDARDSAATPRVTPYIGRQVVREARPAGANRWRGSMRVGQYELNGTLTLRPGETFVMSGCVFVVMCDDFTLIPAQ